MKAVTWPRADHWNHDSGLQSGVERLDQAVPFGHPRQIGNPVRCAGQIGAANQVIGRRHDRRAVAGVDENSRSGRRRERTRSNAAAAQNRQSAPAAVRPGRAASRDSHDLVQRAFESRLDCTPLVGDRGQSAQQAHLRILVLQLEAVLQLALVRPRRTVRMRQQRGRHRLERAHAASRARRRGARRASGKAQRQLFGTSGQRLDRLIRYASDTAPPRSSP